MAATFTREGIAELVASAMRFPPTAGQMEAIDALSRFIIRFREPVGFVLSGYAGTGKTTLVGALTAALSRLNIQTVLLAPTGRAAKVMGGYAGRPAYTIHKYIYYTGLDESGFLRTSLRKNKLSQTLFIVDEASMMNEDEGLLSDLMTFVYTGYRCRLLFVGDRAQLPPVGSSYSPALEVDFLNRHFAHLDVDFTETRLTEVLRQAASSLILSNATYLRQRLLQDDFTLPVFDLTGRGTGLDNGDGAPGVEPDKVGSPESSCKVSANENVVFDLPNRSRTSHERSEGKTSVGALVKKDLFQLKGEDFEDTLQSVYGCSAREDVVFITRSNKRANLFNKAIRERVFGLEEEVSAGDLLMVVRNNYYWTEQMEKIGFLANGDMIEVLKVRQYKDLYGFRFADIEARLTDYPDEPPLELKICLDCLHVEGPSLSYAQNRQLWDEVMLDYAHLRTKAERVAAVKKDPYVNALQVKYAYALTCHKTQGGQWPTVFVDLGYFTDDMLEADFFRWLYTALTRAEDRLYLVGFDEKWMF